MKFPGIDSWCDLGAVRIRAQVLVLHAPFNGTLRAFDESVTLLMAKQA